MGPVSLPRTLFPDHIDTETGRLVPAPDDCQCDGCLHDVEQAALYDQIQGYIVAALRLAADLDWGPPVGPVSTVRSMVDNLGSSLFPSADQAAKYRKRALSAAVRRQVLERDAYRCQWPACGSWVDLTVDHIIPEVEGGTDDLGNLQTLCRPHNSEKGMRVL